MHFIKNKNLKNKQVKVVVLLLMLFFFLISCTTNINEAVFTSNAEESTVLKNSLSELNTKFDTHGNRILSENLSGNILFDFGFDFIYPVELSYNNGVQVQVNNQSGLISILKNSTDSLYVEGIVFPFEVATYERTTKTIESKTITNELNFEVLISEIQYIKEFTSIALQYNPRCVKIPNTLGEILEIQFFDEVHAAYFGFETSDFVYCEQICYAVQELNECFSFNYPLNIYGDFGGFVSINSDEFLCEVLFTVFEDFIYPFTVTMNGDNSTKTINNSLELENLLLSCSQ